MKIFGNEKTCKKVNSNVEAIFIVKTVKIRKHSNCMETHNTHVYIIMKVNRLMYMLQ